MMQTSATVLAGTVPRAWLHLHLAVLIATILGCLDGISVAAAAQCATWTTENQFGYTAPAGYGSCNCRTVNYAAAWVVPAGAYEWQYYDDCCAGYKHARVKNPSGYGRVSGK